MSVTTSFEVTASKYPIAISNPPATTLPFPCLLGATTRGNTRHVPASGKFLTPLGKGSFPQLPAMCGNTRQTAFNPAVNWRVVGSNHPCTASALLRGLRTCFTSVQARVRQDPRGAEHARPRVRRVWREPRRTTSPPSPGLPARFRFLRFIEGESLCLPLQTIG